MYTHAGSMSICKQCRHSIRKDVSKLSLYFLRFRGRKRGVNLLPFYSQMKSQYFPCSVPRQRKTEGRDWEFHIDNTPQRKTREFIHLHQFLEGRCRLFTWTKGKSSLLVGVRPVGSMNGAPSSCFNHHGSWHVLLRSDTQAQIRSMTQGNGLWAGSAPRNPSLESHGHLVVLPKHHDRGAVHDDVHLQGARSGTEDRKLHLRCFLPQLSHQMWPLSPPATMCCSSKVHSCLSNRPGLHHPQTAVPYEPRGWCPNLTVINGTLYLNVASCSLDRARPLRLLTRFRHWPVTERSVRYARTHAEVTSFRHWHVDAGGNPFPGAQVQSLPNLLSYSGGWTLICWAGHLSS